MRFCTLKCAYGNSEVFGLRKRISSRHRTVGEKLPKKIFGLHELRPVVRVLRLAAEIFGAERRCSEPLEAPIRDGKCPRGSQRCEVGFHMGDDPSGVVVGVYAGHKDGATGRRDVDRSDSAVEGLLPITLRQVSYNNNGAATFLRNARDTGHDVSDLVRFVEVQLGAHIGDKRIDDYQRGLHLRDMPL